MGNQKSTSFCMQGSRRNGYWLLSSFMKVICHREKWGNQLVPATPSARNIHSESVPSSKKEWWSSNWRIVLGMAWLKMLQMLTSTKQFWRRLESHWSRHWSPRHRKWRAAIPNQDFWEVFGRHFGVPVFLWSNSRLGSVGPLFLIGEHCHVFMMQRKSPLLRNDLCVCMQILTRTQCRMCMHTRAHTHTQTNKNTHTHT